MLLTSLLMLATAQVSCPVVDTAAPSPEAIERAVLVRAQESVCASVAGQFDSTKLSLLSVANMPEELLETSGLAEFDVGSMRTGRVPVTTVWTNSKGMRQRGVIWFRVYGMTEAWVFNVDVKAEAVIGLNDVNKALVDLAAAGLSRDRLPSNPVDMAVTKAARKGQLVEPTLLRVAALVPKRQNVRVTVHQEGMRIVTRAVALTTGWNKNDDVQIEVAGSTAPVIAKVAGKDEVYVEM